MHLRPCALRLSGDRAATRLLPPPHATPAPSSPPPSAPDHDLSAFHARLAAALAAAGAAKKAVAEWRGRRPALPSYGSGAATATQPAAEVAGDARLLEAWHEGAWAALAHATAAMGSGEWDTVLGE